MIRGPQLQAYEPPLPRLRQWSGYLCALAIGLAFVLTIFPADLLTSGVVPDTRLNGDVATHVAGQRAFIEDAWHWPLLRTTLLDAPRGLNIAMTDSNPLVALPLKLFRFLLPPGFTAIQLWLAVCYLLQPVAAVFALRSAGETRLLPAVAVAVFAISMPTFLFRHTHSSLSAHFILLLALGSYFRTTHEPGGERALPLILLPVSLLIHPYLAFMTFAILAAAPASLALCASRAAWPAAATLIGAVLLTVLVSVVLGYQAAPPANGFGIASMNLVSPIYPSYSSFLGARAPFVDATGLQFEGYQYLGLGLLLLLAVTLLAVCFSTRTVFLRRHLGLLAMSLCLTALALSDIVYLGTHRLLDLGTWPAVFNQLKASGRLFWPVTYLLMVGAVATTARLLPRLLWPLLLIATAALQFADSQFLAARVRTDLRATAVLPIDPARLDQLLAASATLTILPSFGCGADATRPEFMQLILAATRHRVAVNTMYVARFPRLQSCSDSATAQTPLAPNELRVFLPIDAVAGPAAVPGAAALCRRLSIITVCTRNVSLLAGLPPPPPPLIALGAPISVAFNGQTNILGTGWYIAEPEGVWSVDRVADVTVQAPLPAGDVAFAAHGYGYTGIFGTSQRIAFTVNGQPVAAWDMPNQHPVTVSAIIPRADLHPGAQLLQFHIANPIRPSTLGVSTDTRQLGLFLESIQLQPAGK